MDALYFDTSTGKIKSAGTSGSSSRDVNLTQDGIQAGGGGSAVVPQGAVVSAPVGPTRAQIDPLLSALATLDDVLSNRNSQSRSEYSRAIKGYDEQDQLDRGAYDKNVDQNEQSFTTNNQRALLNAANASSGLRGVLSSLGALGGSGVDIVRRLVGLAANEDTGASRQNFDVNADNLTTSWSAAEREQRQRRQDAEATLSNEMQNNKADVLNSRQSIYKELAGLYGPDASEGMDYASKASALSAPIAATTRATVAPYAKSSSLYSPGALQEYLAGTQNLEVDTSGKSSTPINSPIFSNGKKKEQLAGVA